MLLPSNPINPFMPDININYSFKCKAKVSRKGSELSICKAMVYPIE